MLKALQLSRAALAVLFIAGPALAKGTTETIPAPFDDVWKATLQVIAEEFTLGGSNREDGVISFRSGTQDCSAPVVKNDQKSTNITVNPKRARAGVSIGMGKGGTE